MAEIQRDVFPPHIMQRIQTPVPRGAMISSIAVSRDRPWGGILYPVAQQSDGVPQKRGRNVG